MKIKHVEPYAKLRKDGYMSVCDQLDALYKLAKKMEENGFIMPVDVREWIESCSAVKNKYKKN
ncbi:hypothetical protein OSH04_13335 [Alcaligenes sp. A-TC2]|uniref:hypothetical protein n=1 Tax=Alcaligenes nematophilus TaxID=2994643 RepID=UPI00224D4302|nr:hypothetical protein [Alcaligenes nematophilus]MCX5472701.1 hypothetical protein [Alcaligenes nematophilus]